MNSQLRHLSILAFGTRGEMVNYLHMARPYRPGPGPAPANGSARTSISIFTCLHTVVGMYLGYRFVFRCARQSNPVFDDRISQIHPSHRNLRMV